MVFIVSLFAAPAVTDDRILLANRATTNHDLSAGRSPIGHRVVFRDGK